MTDLAEPPVIDAPAAKPAARKEPRRHKKLIRKVWMRPRRTLVLVHRWVSIVLFAWVVVVAFSGAWLAVDQHLDRWLSSERYDATDGDVGPAAALAGAKAALPEDATTYGLTVPGNGGGVYQVYGEVPPEDPDSTEEPTYYNVFVDPGTGEANAVVNDAAGFSHWLLRGHLYFWQDHGPFDVFAHEGGWCTPSENGHEPGGVKGVACDVIPDGMDVVGWFGAFFLLTLLSGFYLWYWPGVRRWATAFTIKRGRGRFAFQMSLHKVIGFVFWVPLVVLTFTGIAFAFPNLNKWYENATPAARDYDLWVPPEDLVSSEADGREPLTLDEARAIYAERYPEREVNYLEPPADETGTFISWMTRGFDPWTAEGGAGNTYTFLDQYTGETLYDEPPSAGNVFDQAWDDWSYPLHTGDFLSTPTRVLWITMGAAPIALGVTGLILYVVRLGKRKKNKARKSTAVETADV